MGKEPAPKFTNYAKDKNGEIWCFDETTKLVCRVIPVAPSSIPQEVLYELLQIKNT